MSLYLAATPARAAQLLNDFICSPVSMKPAAHLAYIHQLHTLAQHGAPKASQPTYMEWAADGYRGAPWSEPLYDIDPATGIATLEITGPLVKGYDDVTCWLHQAASIDRISRDLATLDSNTAVRAIILILNTPGGVSIGMPELADQIATMATRRPVVAYTSDTAASNGMRIAAAAGAFFPTASACVGCIGTYIALYDYTKMLEDYGIKLELYRAGKFKGIGLEGKTTAPEEAAFIQDSVNRSNEIFRNFVRARRPGVADEAMEGQWMDGTQAVECGLAQATVTGLPEVLRTLAAQLGS